MITIEDIKDFQQDFPRSYPSVSSMVAFYYETAGFEPDPDTCYNLVYEEKHEWDIENSRRWWDEDYKPEEELKELADLIYVIHGYALSRGWDLDEAVYRVHLNNLQRMLWDDGLIHRDERGKILKNPSAPKVNLENLVK